MPVLPFRFCNGKGTDIELPVKHILWLKVTEFGRGNPSSPEMLWNFFHVFSFLWWLEGECFQKCFFSVASSRHFSTAISKISFKNVDFFSRFFDFPY